MDKIKTLELSLSRQLEWVKAAESRISFIVSMSTAMIGVIAILSQQVNCWTLLQIVVTSVTVFLLLLSILFAALAAFPRTKGPENSLIYFGAISQKGLRQFSDSITEMEEKEYLDDLISQCHRNAEIAERKYYWIKRSMLCLFLVAIPWVISIYLLYN